MKLTQREQEMLAGDHGWPCQIAMEMLVAIGKANDAERLIPVASAHLAIDAATIGSVGCELLEQLRDAGGRFIVPTSLNAITVDRRTHGNGHGKNHGKPHELIQERILEVCEDMGAIPVCSCNPFAFGLNPLAGQSVAWSESAAAPFINSCLDARSNREGASALASALTGLTVKYGMHLEENRAGEILIEVPSDLRGVDEFGTLGSLTGRLYGGKVPVFSGIERASHSELYALGAAYAMTSTGAIFHVLGVTPNSADVAMAFPKGAPASERIDRPMLDEERERCSSGDPEKIGAICIGSPHATIADVIEIDRLLDGKAISGKLPCYLHLGASTYGLGKLTGHIQRLEKAGLAITVDKLCWGCGKVYPDLQDNNVLLTNSVKMALVSPGSRNVGTVLASLEKCIEIAKGGKENGNQVQI